MLKARFKFIIVFSLVFCLFSCHTSKKTTKSTTTDKETLTPKGAAPLDVFLNNLEKNKIDASWLSAKADMNYADREQEISANVALILRKDSALLVAFRKFGFEALRVLITKDSVCILNRLTSEYTKKPLSFIQEQFNLPANFNTVQSFVLGNPVFLNKANKPLLQKTDSTLTLTEIESGLECLQSFEDENGRLEDMRFQQLTSVRKISIALDKYAATCTTCNNSFAFLRHINAISPEIGEADIELRFTEIELNKPKTMRFEVPNGYKRVN